MAELEALDALSGNELRRAHFQVRECTRFGLLRLQAFHREAGQLAELEHRIGLALPAAGGVERHGEWRILWCAPGEWIFLVPHATESDALCQLQTRVGGLLATLTPISDSRVVLALAGDRLLDVLSRGSSVDFDPEVVGNDHCITTRFAGLTLMVARFESEEGAILLASRPVADWLFEWLGAASRDL